MLKSMTAFTRLQKSFSKFDIACELQSVNRKHLDIQCTLPKEIAFLENEVRKQLAKRMSRGQVSVSVYVDYKDSPPYEVVVVLPLAKKIRHAVLVLAKELDCPQMDQPEALLSHFFREGVVAVRQTHQEDAALQRSVLEVVDAATCQFNKMREREGKYLQKEFENRLKAMKKRLAIIGKQLPSMIEKYKNRLLKLPEDGSTSRELMVAAYRDKIDISEELSRFSYHVGHVLEILQSKESSGKLIEFVLQELLREANTMGSKAQEAVITKNIILIKNEIEKIREQIQNVE